MEDKETRSMTELHPLTELMLARMKSHPEEFRLTRTEDVFHVYRWDDIVVRIQNYGSEADKQALADGLNPIRMDEAHEWALDELLNGEERRRKQREEEEEYERRMSAGQRQIMVNQAAINSSYANQASPYGVASALSGLGASTVTTSPTESTFSKLIKRIKL